MISLHHPVLKALWVIGIAAITWISLLEPGDLVTIEDVSDKMGHFLAYFGIALIGFFAASSRIHRGWIAIAMLALGLFLEYLQIGVPGRSFEWLDWLADGTGIALAAALHHWRDRIRRHKTGARLQT